MGSAAFAINGVDTSTIRTPIARAKTVADWVSETGFFFGENNEQSDRSFGVLINFCRALFTGDEFSQSPFLL